jgi:biopolymer transport protein TolR
MAEINVVPYIDVMLVLLIIFMIATPLLHQGVQVNLPQASAKPLTEKQKDPIIVTVDADGRYYLNISENPTKPISSAELATRIAAELQLAEQAGQQRAVLIKGDQTVDYGKVMQAMILLQQAGVADVGLMTKPLESAAAA